MHKPLRPPPRAGKHELKSAWITARDYDRIVDIYAKHEANYTKVAAELGWKIERVKLVYFKGYKSKGFPPVKLLLQNDEARIESIRAKRAELQAELPASEPIVATTPAGQIAEVEQKAEVINEKENRRVRALIKLDEERRKAREDAIQVRAEEAMMISVARRNALALNGVTAKVLKGAMALSEVIQHRLEQEARTGTLSTKEMLDLVKSAAGVARFNSEVTVLAVKSERAVLGEPLAQASLGDSEDDGSLNSAVEWIERAVAAVQRAKARGVLSSKNAEQPAAEE